MTRSLYTWKECDPYNYMLKSYLYSLTDSPRLAHIYTYIENTQFTKINNSVLMLIYAKTIERGLTNQYLFLFNKSRDSNCCHKFKKKQKEENWQSYSVHVFRSVGCTFMIYANLFLKYILTRIWHLKCIQYYQMQIKICRIDNCWENNRVIEEDPLPLFSPSVFFFIFLFSFFI